MKNDSVTLPTPDIGPNISLDPIQALESVLLDYVTRYGMTDMARAALLELERSRSAVQG